MRLLKESVLQIWKARKAAVRDEIASAERVAKAIQDKLDRLDEAFLFERSIDIETYERHAEKLREELTLARMDRHSGQLDELNVEGILAFAERVLPRAADLWVQASLDQRQRFQQLFFPEGISFDGKGFVRTAVTAPAFSYLRPIECGNEGLVAQTGIEPLPLRAPITRAHRLLIGPRAPTRRVPIEGFVTGSRRTPPGFLLPDDKYARRLAGRSRYRTLGRGRHCRQRACSSSPPTSPFS